MANTFDKYFIDIVPYLDIQINEEYLYLIKTLNTFIILMRLTISVISIPPKVFQGKALLKILLNSQENTHVKV